MNILLTVRAYLRSRNERLDFLLHKKREPSTSHGGKSYLRGRGGGGGEENKQNERKKTYPTIKNAMRPNKRVCAICMGMTTADFAANHEVTLYKL
jgi:GMP synthase-like glutamine amidotransferase